MHTRDKPDRKEIEQCIALGNEAFSNAQLLEATTRYAKARLLLKQADIADSVELRHCLERLAEIYQQRSMPEDGLEIVLALRELDDSLANRRAYVSLLAHIASDYQKQGDRERAEAAYGEALAEATELLPPSDPLIGTLNNACIEYFKRTFKSKKLTVTDTNVKLARLPTDAPIAVPPEPEKKVKRPARSAGAIYTTPSTESGAAAQSGRLGPFSLKKIQIVLQSSVVSLGLSLLLIFSLIQAALFMPPQQSDDKQLSIESRIQNRLFVAGDKRSAFTALGKNLCRIKTPAVSLRAELVMVENTWSDLMPLLHGFLSRDEHWYQMRGINMLDSQNITLYRSDPAPGKSPPAGSGDFLHQADSPESAPPARVPRVIVVGQSGQESTIKNFRAISCTLAWLWAVVTALWCFSVFKVRQSFMLKCTSVLITAFAWCALAYWYIIALAPK
jgi:tetratricopeptide (TPR) repeat protein